MMEENSDTFHAGGDARVYLAGPMHKNYPWGHKYKNKKR